MDLNLAVGIPGASVAGAAGGAELRGLAHDLLRDPRPAARGDDRCPADRRIEGFLNGHFADLTRGARLRLPPALALPRHGVARELSLPADGDCYRNEYVTSYRVRNGVLHNPRSDRRTTQGTFHVCEGGLPIPGDKKAVPRPVFTALFRQALTPPADLLTVPQTYTQAELVRAFVSLLLRPIVCPEIPGVGPEKSMEVRFFAPAGLVSNLDFVESIFGNAGDPFLPENDAGLDAEHWTGHTGCVLLAPHLTRLTKKELGLPAWDAASERQRRDGMCSRDPDELYNDGQAFKVTCRDATGVIVTLIADNYYGYCKKEVKTQISYAANLFGNAEEEHAGGALAFPRYNLGADFDAADYRTGDRTLAEAARLDPETIDLRPEGYGVDRRLPDLVYVPHDACASLARLQVWWTQDGREASLPLRPGKTYMTPSGYKVQMEKHPSTGNWRLIGATAEGLFCHKPCTVSGGGKSEISKSLGDYVLYSSIFVSDLEKDFDRVQCLFDRDYADRWKPGRGPDYSLRPSRPLLSPLRSLGSVIQLLTPSDDYTAEYNAWLASFPDHIYPLVYLIKRYIPPQAQGNWRDLLGVDSINGRPGHELKAMGRRLVGNYLTGRPALLPGVADLQAPTGLLPGGEDPDGGRHHGLGGCPGRPAASSPARLAGRQLQVRGQLRVPPVPAPRRRGPPRSGPADRGGFGPARQLPLQFRAADGRPGPDPCRSRHRVRRVQPAHARAALGRGCGRLGRRRLFRPAATHQRQAEQEPSLPADTPRPARARVAHYRRARHSPGEGHDEPRPAAVARRRGAGRPTQQPSRPRGGHPAAGGLRPDPLSGAARAVHGLHLLADGQEPLDHGGRLRGALTKAPFNALRTIIDLNAALVSYILTGLPGYSTAAGYVGPDKRVDHDISLLIPEVWCRLTPKERDPAYLIAEDCLEPLRDFEHAGRLVLASRLGYRVTAKFARKFLGRVFDHPDRVFDEAYLRPETQDLEAFVDGVHNITEAQRRVALQAFEDGSIEQACPPLRVLLSIMAHGAYEGKNAHHPDVRGMFTLEALQAGEWYQERLRAKQRVDERLWRRHVAALDAWLAENAAAGVALASQLRQRREYAADRLSQVTTPEYLESLRGTLGVEPGLHS